MKISDLTPFDKNPRKIGKDQLERLKKSLKDFKKGMEAKPIIIDENNTILAGHQRIKALKEDGQTEIPDNWIKKIENLTEEEKQLIILLLEAHKESGKLLLGFGKPSKEDINQEKFINNLVRKINEY